MSFDDLFNPDLLPPPDKYGERVHPAWGQLEIAYVHRRDQVVDFKSQKPEDWKPIPPKGEGWVLVEVLQFLTDSRAGFVRKKVAR